MKSHLILFFLLICNFSIAQITLSHNIGSSITGTNINGCSGGNVFWARTFTLEDFGIAADKDFIITSGEVAVTYEDTNWDSRIQFNIYAINEGFPLNFNEESLIGSSQIEEVWMEPAPYYTFVFETPLTIPANVDRILVEVKQLPSNNSSAVLFCSGTEEDNDISWFKACNTSYSYVNTTDIDFPDANFYITVKGVEADPIMSIGNFKKESFIYPNPTAGILNIEEGRFDKYIS